MREITSKRVTLQEEIALVGRHLQDVRVDSAKYIILHSELVAALCRIKTEAEALISTHKEGVVINAHIGRVPEEAELKLTRVVEHARLESQRRTLEDIHTRDIDLSAELEKVKTLEERAATLFAFGDA